jgi:hypothetical protein
LALPFQHLTVIRNAPPPSGPKTRQLCEGFTKAGGKFIALTEEDLRTLLALQIMLNKRVEDFGGWLKQRKPLNDIALFYGMGEGGSAGTSPRKVKHAVAADPDGQPCAIASDRNPVQAAPASREEARPNTTRKTTTKTQQLGIPIGHRLIGGQPEQPRFLALSLLPRHTAMLAGSGSSKGSSSAGRAIYYSRH